MTFKRAVVISNGNLSDAGRIKENLLKDDFLICADGAANQAIKLGIIPHVIIGDEDSLSPIIKKQVYQYHIKCIRFPTRKNETDFELAVFYALKQKLASIVIFCILGDRLDHLLANIFYLFKVKTLNKNVKIEVIEEKQKMYFITERIVLRGKKGDLVSLLPISKKVEGISTTGLEYLLQNASLEFGPTRGISNVMTKPQASISLKKGVLLVVHHFGNNQRPSQDCNQRT